MRSAYIKYALSAFTETKLNLMERFMREDTASCELFFNIFTSGVDTTVIPWDQRLYCSVVEVCRLGLETMCDTLCQSENTHADRT